MKNFREKLIVFVLIAGGIIVLLQTSLLQKALQTLFPVRHTLEANTLSSSVVLAWTYYSDNDIAVPPKGNDELVVVFDDNGRLTALDNTSGKTIWEYTVPSRTGHLWSNHVFDLDNEVLITSERDNGLLALDVTNGQEAWRTPLVAFRTTPDIVIVGSVVIVSIFSTRTTEGYVAIYKLEDGTLLWDKPLPNRAYEHTFKCPFISESLGLSTHNNSSTVCLSLFDQLQIIDTSEEAEIKVIGSINRAFPSNDIPYYQAGTIFTNPNPNPKVQSYDVVSDNVYELPADCLTERGAQPVSSNELKFLVANGCNEIYILNKGSLRATPEWILRSDNILASPFVTVNGESGFVLNDEAEIMEIDLSEGELIGKLVTAPSQLQIDHATNSLVPNPPYLYALMDGHTLFGLQTR